MRPHRVLSYSFTDDGYDHIYGGLEPDKRISQCGMWCSI